MQPNPAIDRIEVKAALTAAEDGTIEGIAWPYGTVDLVGDEIEPKAFEGATAPLPMLFQHDEPVGVWDEIKSTADGLIMKGRLLINSVARAAEARSLIVEKAVQGLSIGFVTEKASPRQNGGRKISRLTLKECSLVAVPCNPDARITFAKELNMTAAPAVDTTPAASAPAIDIAAIDEKIAGVETKVSTRLDKVEARLSRSGDNDNVEAKSIGQQFVETEDYKAFASSQAKGRASLSVKAITTAPATVGTGTDGSTSIVPSHHVPGIVTPAERALTIRGLLAQGSMETGVLQYVRETGFTNAAAIVAEGAAKPYSDITFNQITQPAVVIAHMFKASKQVLEDSAMLASYIDTRARYGLASKEEDYLLNDATSGLITNATDFDTALVQAGDNKADYLRRAILQVRLAEYRATGIVMNPTDWADIEVLKETTGGYVWSNPTVNNGQNLWGLPVVDTTAVAAGEFLVGAFSIAAQIFDRWQARVEVSTENDDDFEKNLVSIRAEERLALAIFRPESFVHGEFDSGS